MAHVTTSWHAALDQTCAKGELPHDHSSGAKSEVTPDPGDLEDLLDLVGAKITEVRDDSGADSGHTVGTAAEAKHSVDNLASGVRLGRRQGCATASESKDADDNRPAEVRAAFKIDADSAARSNAVSDHRRRGPRQVVPPRLLSQENVTMDQAVGIRRLLFNDTKRVLPDSWRRQGFFFSRASALGYGLIQSAGGPCGVLASVQAFVLRELLFPTEASPVSDYRNPTPIEQARALVSSLARIIFTASGSSGHCFVFLPSKSACLSRSSSYSPDGVTEKLQCWELAAESCSSLELFIGEHLRHFSDPFGCGAVLLLFSCIMTRGLANVKMDMDEGFVGEVRTLLDRHAYMAQEGVNLLLVGKAVTNVFDGDRKLSDEGSSGDVVTLCGIPQRGTVGFLTLLESYNYLEVGRHYKEPEVPVWVVFSESHYSVLFGLDLELSQSAEGGRSRDIFYWDGLAKQREEIMLTVLSEHDEELPDQNDPHALIPPLDLVCRTKWRGAMVDWNGAEEIL